MGFYKVSRIPVCRFACRGRTRAGEPAIHGAPPPVALLLLEPKATNGSMPITRGPSPTSLMGHTRYAITMGRRALGLTRVGHSDPAPRYR